MAPTPLGRGAIGRVASTLACIAIVAGTVIPAAACARPAQGDSVSPPTATTAPIPVRPRTPARRGRSGANGRPRRRPPAETAPGADGRSDRRRDTLLGVPRPGHRAAVLVPQRHRHVVHRVDGQGLARRRRAVPLGPTRPAAQSRPDRPDDPRQRRQRGRDHLLNNGAERQHRPDDPDLPAHRHKDLLRLVEHDDDVRPGRGPARRVHRQRRRRRSTLDRLAAERDAPGARRGPVRHRGRCCGRRRPKRSPSRTAGPCTTPTTAGG